MHWDTGLNGPPGAAALPGGLACPGNDIILKTFTQYDT